MSGLIDRMKAADEADVLIAFENNKTATTFITKEAKGIPFDIKDLAARVRHGELLVDFGATVPLKMEVIAKDADSAKQLMKSLVAVVDLGATVIPDARKEIKGKLEEVNSGDDSGFVIGSIKDHIIKRMELDLKMHDIAQSVIDKIATETEGDRLIAKVSITEGIPQFVETVGEMLLNHLEMGKAAMKEFSDIAKSIDAEKD